jgi:hypothetical protein
MTYVRSDLFDRFKEGDRVCIVLLFLLSVLYIFTYRTVSVDGNNIVTFCPAWKHHQVTRHKSGDCRGVSCPNY